MTRERDDRIAGKVVVRVFTIEFSVSDQRCLLSSKNILSDSVPAMPLVKKTKMHIKKLPKLLEEHLKYLNLNGMEWHEAHHQEQLVRQR